MHLHEAIDAVLEGRPAGMTAREIADEINRRGLHRRKDGQPVPAGQVTARIGNDTYRDRYTRDYLVRISRR